MTALPITGFNYGHLAPTSRASVRLGRMVCTGEKQFADRGQSCRALK